jgi:lipopolysaccharide/colanic/teichoic acid biosynthesis glycosyltransferase
MNVTIINRPRVYPHNGMYLLLKRVMDISLCILAIPFLIPLFAICALLIALDSPGPVFFVQDRIGKGGRRFRLIKFRTMACDLNEKEHRAYMKSYIKGMSKGNGQNDLFKPVHTLKITRVGRILRKTSMDEFPQLINVIRGEMSIVGPRPNVTWEVEEYHPWHYERLEVLPGITGLAQIHGRSCIDFNSLVRHDIEYIEKQSISLDIQILLMTINTVLGARGAY